MSRRGSRHPGCAVPGIFLFERGEGARPQDGHYEVRLGETVRRAVSLAEAYAFREDEKPLERGVHYRLRRHRWKGEEWR